MCFALKVQLDGRQWQSCCARGCAALRVLPPLVYPVCACVCACVRMRVHVRVHVFMCICACVCLCACACACACALVCLLLCACACMRALACMCMRLCACARACACACACLRRGIRVRKYVEAIDTFHVHTIWGDFIAVCFVVALARARKRTLSHHVR